jgi:hypothetical protein
VHSSQDSFQVCSAPANVCLVLHSTGAEVLLGSNEEQFP